MAPSSDKRSYILTSHRDFAVSDPDHCSWTAETEGDSQRRSVMLNIKYRYLALATILVSAVSFVFCIVYSFIFHFDEVTSSHCNVWNLAPSVSASIGSNAPQRYVWTLVMALHTGPRLVLAAINHSVYSACTAGARLRVARLTSLLALCELASLLLVTVVPSVELYSLHILATGAFLVTSGLHMALSCHLVRQNSSSGLFKMGRNHYLLRKSLHYKQVLLMTHLSSIAISLYFYWRHNAYCEPGIYSVFSLCEYVVILSNLGYHATSYYDYYHVTINLSSLL